MKFITAIYIVIIYKAIKRNGFDITIDFCCKWKPNMPKRNRSIPLVEGVKILVSMESKSF